MSDESLRQEIAEQRQRIEEVDDWANGLFEAMHTVLSVVLKGHPDAGQIEQQLRYSRDRYETLMAHPERAEPGETAELHEAGKMLYERLAMLGVWPGVDPAEVVQRKLATWPRRPGG